MYHPRCIPGSGTGRTTHASRQTGTIQRSYITPLIQVMSLLTLRSLAKSGRVRVETVSHTVAVNEGYWGPRSFAGRAGEFLNNDVVRSAPVGQVSIAHK